MIRAGLVFAALMTLSACGGGAGGESAAPTPCPLPEESGDKSLVPRDLDLTEYGVLAETTVTKGFLAARFVSETKIVELYPPIARGLLDHGFEILSGDNEGFEAEIFFESPSGDTGSVYMREGPCAGQATLILRYGTPRYGGKG